MGLTPQPPQPNFIEKLAASWLAKRLGNYKTTAIGIMVATAGAVTSFTPIIPPKYQPYAVTGATFLGGLALLLAKD